MEDSYTSSPDPLANSTRTAPSTDRVARRKSTRLAPVKPTLPSASRTPSRAPTEIGKGQTVQLQNFVFDTPQEQQSFSSSPTKSGIKTENHISPWRIRVTVEAERDGENDGADIGYLTEADMGWKGEDSGSPSRGRTRRTRTTTTKVPLKGLEPSPPPPKRRGRPKKSETPARPRNGTPAPKTRGRRKTTGGVSGDEGNGDPDLATPNRPRGRSRRRLVTAEDDAGTILDLERNDGASEETVILAIPSPVKVKTTAKKTREKRKAKSPIKIAIDPDVQLDDAPVTSSLEQMPGEVGHANELPPVDVQTNQISSALAGLSVNSMSMVERSELDGLAPAGDEDFGEQLAGPVEKFSPAKKTPVRSKQTRQATSVDAISAPPSSTKHPVDPLPLGPSVVGLSGEPQTADDPGYATGGEPQAGEFGGLDDSVLESEGFSMVSISSIATAGGYMSSPIPQELHRDNTERDLVESLIGMNLHSPSAQSHSGQRAEGKGSLTQEEQWQLERNAVSRQIEMANSSQVITINSDSEPASDEDGESFVDPDEEYRMYRSRVLQKQEQQLQEDCQYTSDLEMQGSKDLNDLFSNEDTKPRRGKIPSPWRADHQVTYSDEVEPIDDSGLLPQPRQEQLEEQEKEKWGDAEGVESPTDLSALLGLKSSPDKYSRTVGKSLRQRLIEKFYQTKQEETQVEEHQTEEPADTKLMEISGRLVLYPSLKPAGHESDVSKGDGLPVLGPWGANNTEPPAARKKLAEGRRHRNGKRAEQPPAEQEEVHVGKALGARTFGPSPPDGPITTDESTTTTPPAQAPLTQRLLSARTADHPPTTPGPTTTTTTTTTTKPHSFFPPPTATAATDPAKWTPAHWKALNHFWHLSKRRLRGPPATAPTNLAFHCPGARALRLSDAEMGVVGEFVR
ncbi:hypothetical protein FGG08_006145, partial [Glutinoglossum americanum]